jgi:hypothetical protein
MYLLYFTVLYIRIFTVLHCILQTAASIFHIASVLLPHRITTKKPALGFATALVMSVEDTIRIHQKRM